MARNSNIEWTEHTFNPWLGCTKISPACDGCYAEAMIDRRFGRVKWGGPRLRTGEANWEQPRKWNAAAARSGTRHRVFCASLADVFDNQVPAQWRTDLFELICSTPSLTWMLLTKRPQNIVTMIDQSGILDDHGVRRLPSNAALGATVEDQRRAEMNIPALLRAKSVLAPAFAFILCEPLLGPLDLGHLGLGARDVDIAADADLGLSIDWVVAGGETDQGAHRARPTHPDWLRQLRDQCSAARVPFHFRQWGEYREYAGHRIVTSRDLWATKSAAKAKVSWMAFDGEHIQQRAGAASNSKLIAIERLGRRSTGRLIDGAEHNGVPDVFLRSCETQAG